CYLSPPSKVSIETVVIFDFNVCATKAPNTTENFATTAPEITIFLYILPFLKREQFTTFVT
ncbi:MAG: hypothetical protein NXH73_04790, partial [Flavobacteriaceae bacterium]|nr:hypothetical protein [Flavobacteriaceae bacterium]